MHFTYEGSIIFSVTEFISYVTKFKKLLAIPLFKNYRTSNLFKEWRKFLQQTKKLFYTDKLSKRFHRVDEHLLLGIFEVRRILKEMEKINIFHVRLIEFLIII